MPLEVKKKEKESSQSLIRRFSKGIKKSGLLRRARKTRYHERKKSEQMKKRSALKKEELREKYRKMKKLGKM